MIINYRLLIILYAFSPCMSTTSFSEEFAVSSEWVSSTELNNIRVRNNDSRLFPNYIEGRISGDKLQYRATFSLFPFGMKYYYSLWGLSDAWYEHRNRKFLTDGYEQLFHNTFTDTSGNVLHQATWVLLENAPKSYWDRIFEFIFGSAKDQVISATPEGIIILTNETLNQTIELSEGYLLVHFSSYDPGCGYCISSNLFVNKLALKYIDKLTVARMTWDPWYTYKGNSEEITNQYTIIGIPEFIIFNVGNKIWQGSGSTSDTENEMEEILRACCN